MPFLNLPGVFLKIWTDLGLQRQAALGFVGI